MIIVDKPMPEGCDVCPLMYDYISCNALPDGNEADDAFHEFNFDWTVRPDWCPLKEYDAVRPYVTGRGESFETAETWWYACGNCDEALDPNDKYCRHCGRRLKWA